MEIKDLYELYGHLQGQVAAVNNVCAAIAALHPGRQTIERVMEHTVVSTGYKRTGSTAEKAYAEGMESAMAVFRAALAGVAPLTGDKH